MGDDDARPATGGPDEGGWAVPPTPPRSHRGMIIGFVVVAVVAAIAVAVAFATGALDREPAATPTPEAVTLPSPTPTVAPVAHEALSPFADALPSSVLQYALTSVTEERSLLVAGALEGYRLDYSDGGDGALTVLAGQWPTPEEAAGALTALTAGAAPVDDGGPASGDVVVDGTPAGTWTLTASDAGPAALTWTNATALLRALGSPETVRDVFAAYPL